MLTAELLGNFADLAFLHLYQNVNDRYLDVHSPSCLHSYLFAALQGSHYKSMSTPASTPATPAPAAADAAVAGQEANGRPGIIKSLSKKMSSLRRG